MLEDEQEGRQHQRRENEKKGKTRRRPDLAMHESEDKHAEKERESRKISIRKKDVEERRRETDLMLSEQRNEVRGRQSRFEDGRGREEGQVQTHVEVVKAIRAESI